MSNVKREYSGAFKGKVALAALCGEKTANQLGSQFGIHPTLIGRWKKELLAGMDRVFSKPDRSLDSKRKTREVRELSDLYEQIGRLKVELDWVKKKLQPFD